MYKVGISFGCFSSLIKIFLKKCASKITSYSLTFTTSPHTYTSHTAMAPHNTELLSPYKYVHTCQLSKFHLSHTSHTILLSANYYIVSLPSHLTPREQSQFVSVQPRRLITRIQVCLGFHSDKSVKFQFPFYILSSN